MHTEYAHSIEIGMALPTSAVVPAAPRLLDQLRERIRYLHYSLRTEQAYVHWVRAYVRFHGMRHPASMGAAEVQAFLSWLACERKVSVSTHRQAWSAVLFLYQQVLGHSHRAGSTALRHGPAHRRGTAVAHEGPRFRAPG